MGRAPCCSKDLSLNRRAWTAEEDSILNKYISNHGVGGWKYLPQRAGLKRCWKGCRLRWFNYLRPDIKRGNISANEEDLIIKMHNLLGNRWSLIAGRLPGRTDNEIKNYWNTRLLKKVESKEYSPPTAKEVCRTSKPQYDCSKDHQVLLTTAVRLPKDPYKAFVDELITGSDFEIVEYSSAQNTMQWENPRVKIMGQPSSTCLMDNQFSDCPNNREDEVNTCNNSLYLNEMCPAEDNFPWSPYNFITEEWIDELQYL